MYYEIFKKYGDCVVDLHQDADRLPEGWQFVLDNNAYTGWVGDDGFIRFAVVERGDDSNDR